MRSWLELWAETTWASLASGASVCLLITWCPQHSLRHCSPAGLEWNPWIGFFKNFTVDGDVLPLAFIASNTKLERECTVQFPSHPDTSYEHKYYFYLFPVKMLIIILKDHIFLLLSSLWKLMKASVWEHLLLEINMFTFTNAMFNKPVLHDQKYVMVPSAGTSVIFWATLYNVRWGGY